MDETVSCAGDTNFSRAQTLRGRHAFQLFFLQQRPSTATYCQSHLVYISIHLHPSPHFDSASHPFFGTFPCTQLSLESESNVAPERNRPGASILSSMRRLDDNRRDVEAMDLGSCFLRIYRATNVHLFSFSKSSMPTDLPKWAEKTTKKL